MHWRGMIDKALTAAFGTSALGCMKLREHSSAGEEWQKAGFELGVGVFSVEGGGAGAAAAGSVPAGSVGGPEVVSGVKAWLVFGGGLALVCGRIHKARLG